MLRKDQAVPSEQAREAFFVFPLELGDWVLLGLLCMLSPVSRAKGTQFNREGEIAGAGGRVKSEGKKPLGRVRGSMSALDGKLGSQGVETRRSLPPSAHFTPGETEAGREQGCSLAIREGAGPHTQAFPTGPEQPGGPPGTPAILSPVMFSEFPTRKHLGC